MIFYQQLSRLIAFINGAEKICSLFPPAGFGQQLGGIPGPARCGIFLDRQINAARFLECLGRLAVHPQLG
jgi:hypothetical protein